MTTGITNSTVLRMPSIGAVGIDAFDAQSGGALVQRFADVGYRLQRADPGRIPASPAAIAAQLDPSWAFHSYGVTRHLIAVHHGRDVGRCTAMLNARMADVDGQRVGSIGHWECEDDDAAAAALMDAALVWLEQQGAELVVGPLDYSTWYSYRLSLPEPRPAGASIWLEPVTPDHHLQQWRAAGFEIAETYCTRRVPAASQPRRAAEALAQAASAGIRVEPMQPADLDAFMPELHAMATDSFANNHFYSRIELSEFRALYAGMDRVLDPTMSWIARGPQGELAGLILCLPDRFASMRGMRGRASLAGKLAFLRQRSRSQGALIKTLAVAPAFREHGLGSALAERARLGAVGRGYDSIFHVLMHDANRSVSISNGHDGGDIHRRYALMARSIDGSG